MRQLKIARTTKYTSELDIPIGYNFILKIAEQVSANDKELKNAIENGIAEYDRLLKNEPVEIIEKIKIWHIRQFLINQKQINMHQKIEQELQKVEHYQKYPLMKPFIGENYFNAKKKVLIVGESHFFDHEGAINNGYINKGPENWYSGKIALDKSKHSSIHTEQIVKDFKHSIFKQLEDVLTESKIFEKYQNRVLNNVAFMNGFQRPVNKRGTSMKSLASEKDFEEGIKTVSSVINIIDPEYVIFISKYTWEKIGNKLPKKDNIIYAFTFHPAYYKGWHNKNDINSKYRIIELLKER